MKLKEAWDLLKNQGERDFVPSWMVDRIEHGAE